VKIKHKANYTKAYAQPIATTQNMHYPQQVWFIFIHISSTLSALLCTNLRRKTKELGDVYYMKQWVLL